MTTTKAGLKICERLIKDFDEMLKFIESNVLKDFEKLVSAGDQYNAMFMCSTES